MAAHTSHRAHTPLAALIAAPHTLEAWNRLRFERGISTEIASALGRVGSCGSHQRRRARPYDLTAGVPSHWTLNARSAMRPNSPTAALQFDISTKRAS